MIAFYSRFVNIHSKYQDEIEGSEQIYQTI